MLTDNLQLRALLLGTGSPRPSIQRASPSQVVRVGHEPILVDCGDGTLNQLLRAGIHLALIKRVLFTHLHSDHSLGYGAIVLGGWAAGRRSLVVWGPTGTRRFHEILFSELYAEDIAFRVSLGRSGAGLTDIAVHESTGGVIGVEDNLRVTAVTVRHVMPTLAYRFDTNSRSLVISGDTIYSPELVALARNADVLVADACYLPAAHAASEEDAKVLEGLRQHHASPADAGRMAQEAGVRRLVLTHLLPVADPDQIHSECRSTYDGEIIVGHDFMEVIC